MEMMLKKWCCVCVCLCITSSFFLFPLLLFSLRPPFFLSRPLLLIPLGLRCSIHFRLFTLSLSRYFLTMGREQLINCLPFMHTLVARRLYAMFTDLLYWYCYTYAHNYSSLHESGSWTNNGWWYCATTALRYKLRVIFLSLSKPLSCHFSKRKASTAKQVSISTWMFSTLFSICVLNIRKVYCAWCI